MSRRRQEFLPENESPGCSGLARAAGWCVVGPVLGSLICGFVNAVVGVWLGIPILMLSLLATLLLLPWAHRGARRSGVTIDAEGLTEWYDYGFRRRTVWTDVVAVEIETATARLTTTRGRVLLAPPLVDWLRLAHTARKRCEFGAASAEEEEPRRALPRETVAAWLNVPVDGELDCWTSYHRTVLIAALLLTVGLWFVVGPFSLVLLAGLPRGRRRVYRIRANPDGIEVYSPAGRQSYAWSAVTSVTHCESYWQVVTLDGDFTIPRSMRQERILVLALREAIKAREAGWSLPELPVDVPDNALSRLDGSMADSAAERGLSQAPAEPGNMGVAADAM